MKKIKKYFSGVKKEITRVRWTDKKSLIKYSVATISFMIFFGLFFFIIDYLVALVRTMN